jgi:transglutaminase-like putative cysteine protease
MALSPSVRQPPAKASPRRWLRVHHETRYDYGATVELAHHLACLQPRDTPWQQVRAWSLSIDPLPDEWLALPENEPWPSLQHSLDPWGNGRLAFSLSRVHGSLRVASRFEAGLRPREPLALADSPDWGGVAAGLRYHQGLTDGEAVEFSLGTPLAPRDPQLAEYARASFTPGRGLMAAAVELMHRIHADFRYRPASTEVSTSAPQALALRHGVCQDFAHVLIGGLRSLGLAARYVSGYLLTHPPEGQPRLVGADASHAWAEVWCPRLGWCPLDPTNDQVPGLDHVTLAWGRDYADVAPLRGVIRGGGRAAPHVGVTVEPLEEGGETP